MPATLRISDTGVNETRAASTSSSVVGWAVVVVVIVAGALGCCFICVWYSTACVSTRRKHKARTSRQRGAGRHHQRREQSRIISISNTKQPPPTASPAKARTPARKPASASRTPEDPQTSNATQPQPPATGSGVGAGPVIELPTATYQAGCGSECTMTRPKAPCEKCNRSNRRHHNSDKNQPREAQSVKSVTDVKSFRVLARHDKNGEIDAKRSVIPATRSSPPSEPKHSTTSLSTPNQVAFPRSIAVSTKAGMSARHSGSHGPNGPALPPKGVCSPRALAYLPLIDGSTTRGNGNSRTNGDATHNESDNSSGKCSVKESGNFKPAAWETEQGDPKPEVESPLLNASCPSSSSILQHSSKSAETRPQQVGRGYGVSTPPTSEGFVGTEPEQSISLPTVSATTQHTYLQGGMIESSHYDELFSNPWTKAEANSAAGYRSQAYSHYSTCPSSPPRAVPDKQFYEHSQASSFSNKTSTSPRAFSLGRHNMFSNIGSLNFHFWHRSASKNSGNYSGGQLERDSTRRSTNAKHDRKNIDVGNAKTQRE